MAKAYTGGVYDANPKATEVKIQLHGTGLKGSGVSNIIARFFGDLDRWPITQSGFYSFTRDKITAIAEHIDRTGDCLWHAEFVVMGWDRCGCAKCATAPKSIRGAF